MRGVPQSKIAQLGQAAFEYAVSGVGAPSVVLINGSGGPIEGWHKLFDQLVVQLCVRWTRRALTPF